MATALLAAGLLVLILPALPALAEQSAVQDIARTLNQPGGHGDVSKTLSAALGIGGLLVLPLVAWMLLHNALVAREELVFEAWAQTESNFQRRIDLIPALVDTVNRYVRHEADTLAAVTEERSEAVAALPEAIDRLLGAERDSTEILRGGRDILQDEARMQELFAAQQALGRSMTSLFAVAEAYPQLRSADQFLELQAQLEGTENRINVARMRFNEAVSRYNARIRMLPWSSVAALGNFRRKAYFRSDEEAHDAPELALE